MIKDYNKKSVKALTDFGTFYFSNYFNNLTIFGKSKEVRKWLERYNKIKEMYISGEYGTERIAIYLNQQEYQRIFYNRERYNVTLEIEYL